MSKGKSAVHLARKHLADGSSVHLFHPPHDAHKPKAKAPEKLHTGPIHSAVAGRTDHLPVHVPSGSFVLPAHHVSALGDGNTLAGFKVVQRALGALPYGASGTPYGQGSSPYGAEGGPYGSPAAMADGGSPSDAAPVAVVLAGGEYVLTPQEVTAIGSGDQSLGHKVLDEWVKGQTQATAKTIAKLPPPRRD